MNTPAQHFFNALSFANVGNLSEFHTLLRQIDAPDSTVRELREPAKAIAQASDSTPVLGHIQGAV